MKIKLYIVTYKKNDILNQNLESLWANTKNTKDIEVTILANHPDIKIQRKNKRKNLKIITNNTRMPNAWGNLSKDWNFCILDCFKSIQNPNNIDWCVLAQNDITWIKDWDEWLRKNKTYDLVTQPTGDQIIALNIKAVKNIGFFDERLTTLHFHEIDYFIRALIHYEKHISINDNHKLHNLSINSVGNKIINSSFSGFSTDETLHNRKNWQESCNFINKKWNIDVMKINTNYILENKKNLINIQEINWYPFFWEEKNQPNLTKIESKDISVVVQGAINPTETKKCISSIRHKLPEAEIILSTWEGSNLEGLEYDKLILNKDPGAIPITKKIMNNMNRQLLSTQNGLKVAERKYVLKLRSDLILANTNFLKYFNKFLARTDDYKLFERKILTCTLLTRHKIKHEKGFIDIPFHVSDWWFFGLRTDINTLFKDTPLVEEPYFTKYFEQDEHKNKFNPFLGARFQFAPEQYFVYKCFERNFKDIHMEDAADWNENTIEQSKKVIINNFIVLEHKQSGIFLNKYAYSKNELFSGEQYLGLYGFDFYQKEYQKYCDSNYVIKKNLNICKNEEFYIDYFRLNKHIYKLFHEKCSILSKLEQIFFSIPFRSFILILNQFKKMLQITP